MGRWRKWGITQRCLGAGWLGLPRNIGGRQCRSELATPNGMPVSRKGDNLIGRRTRKELSHARLILG